MVGINCAALIMSVSGQCNLQCKYCYRSHSNNSHTKKMSLETYESFAKQYIKICGHPNFIWQGGEPTLRGMEFYKNAFELQRRYIIQYSKDITNAIQTNGTLINKGWAKFFKANNVIVGISIDGPERMHNYYRYDFGGKGSFQYVMRGLKVLQDYGVDCNVLVVLHNRNISAPDRIFKFLLSNDIYLWQFIPCVDLDPKTNRLATYSIKPEQYAAFICKIFDMWIDNDNPKIYIRIVDDLLHSYLGLSPQCCVFKEDCNIITMDYSGDIYPCDSFVKDRWKLGNINSSTLKEILGSTTLEEFNSQVNKKRQNKCSDCQWYFTCYGGCPRYYDFYNKGEDKNLLCPAYQRIFSHFFKTLDRVKKSKASRIGGLIRYYEEKIQDIKDQKMEFSRENVKK